MNVCIKMESEDELKEINIRNLSCYYFDDIIKNIDINFSEICFSLWHFIQVQNHCALGLIK